MDDIVQRAMLKWPNVPDCYGWLALDARGHWRMRDEPTQHANLPGDKIMHVALLGFINRNYACDDTGRWFFQNGPQRVFVNLETTPHVARTDPVHGFMLHTGEVLQPIDAVWLTNSGRIVFDSAGRVAQLDDRDTAQGLAMIYDGAEIASDNTVVEWLESHGASAPLALQIHGQSHVVKWRDEEVLSLEARFVRVPQPLPNQHPVS